MSSTPEQITEIANNLRTVQERMANAALRAGRDPSGVRLIAISKLQPIAKITTAYACGQREFGENRVQEGIEKQDKLQGYPDITWHMVGHIQSRKAEQAALHFDEIHSVDRVKIARRLDQYRSGQDALLPVYLEMNVSGEESKEGLNFSRRDQWEDALQQVKAVFECKKLLVIGLMTMAPWVDDEAILRDTFSRLRGVRDFLEQKLGKSLPHLSMGMTDDFEIAIEEGATDIRVGRAIFGERE
jgi:pyridoxal phosphate enzyme (YggS family)